MSRVTAHMLGHVPIITPPPQIIRGNRAQSLLNLMVPQIQTNLERIQDPAERAQMQDRLDRIANRVEIASANQNDARVIEDVRLSLETLEESVENRLNAMLPSPSP